VILSFRRGNLPDAIQSEFPLLKLPQVYGAIAFYLDHQATIDEYLAQREREFETGGVPLREANPELWAKLERARQEMTDKKT